MNDARFDQELAESIVIPGTRPGSFTEAWRLAFPTMIGMISSTVMWTIDTMTLGRIGKVELAAAGFGGVLIWTLHSFFIGSVNSVNTFAAQAKGAGKPRECSVFAWQGLYLALVSAGILGLLLWKMDWILALAGPEEAVIEECLRYSRIRMAGGFFLLGLLSLFSFFRGIGDVKTPMIVAIVANLFNIVLNWVLIFGIGPFPRWTTFGAGLGTALSDFVAFVIILALFLRPKIAAVYASRSACAFRPAHMLRLIRVGFPMGIQFFLDMGSFSVFLAIMGRPGTDELAASGIGKAATTLVGQYLGAGRRRLAEICGRLLVSCVRTARFIHAKRFLTQDTSAGRHR